MYARISLLNLIDLVQEKLIGQKQKLLECNKKQSIFSKFMIFFGTIKINHDPYNLATSINCNDWRKIKNVY